MQNITENNNETKQESLTIQNKSMNIKNILKEKYFVNFHIQLPGLKTFQLLDFFNQNKKAILPLM